MRLALDRRRFVRTSALTIALLVGLDQPSLFANVGYLCPEAERNGALLGHLEFLNEGPVEMDAAFGEELDGRLYTSLRGITDKELITSADRFYLRARASKILLREDSWKISIEGLVASSSPVGIGELRAKSKPLGLHLMECAGNTRAAHFGMISVGEGTGIPISELLAAASVKPSATQILVSGFDRYVGNSATSTPGDLSAGRTVESVPGDRIGQKAAVARPRCAGVPPQLARDFRAARIEHAAMPIRVEKWQAGYSLQYRVFGILWGGTQTVSAIGIRFNPEEEYVRVDSLPTPQSGTWTLWWHQWRPKESGTHTIRLAILDPALPPQRLESGYHARTVEITEV